MSLINQALAPYNYYNLPFIPQAFTNAMGGYEPSYLGDWHLSSEGWASDTQYYKYYENDRTGDWRIDYWDHKPAENETPQRSEYGGPSYDSIQQQAYAAQQQAQSQANQTPPDEAPAAKSADQNRLEEEQSASGSEGGSYTPSNPVAPGNEVGQASRNAMDRAYERLAEQQSNPHIRDLLNRNEHDLGTLIDRAPYRPSVDVPVLQEVGEVKKPTSVGEKTANGVDIETLPSDLKNGLRGIAKFFQVTQTGGSIYQIYDKKGEYIATYVEGRGLSRTVGGKVYRMNALQLPQILQERNDWYGFSLLTAYDYIFSQNGTPPLNNNPNEPPSALEVSGAYFDGFMQGFWVDSVGGALNGLAEAAPDALYYGSLFVIHPAIGYTVLAHDTVSSTTATVQHYGSLYYEYTGLDEDTQKKLWDGKFDELTGILSQELIDVAREAKKIADSIMQGFEQYNNDPVTRAYVHGRVLGIVFFSLLTAGADKVAAGLKAEATLAKIKTVVPSGPKTKAAGEKLKSFFQRAENQRRTPDPEKTIDFQLIGDGRLEWKSSDGLYTFSSREEYKTYELNKRRKKLTQIPENSTSNRPVFIGTEYPKLTGAHPNSIHIRLSRDGRAVQTTIFNERGEAIAHIDWKDREGRLFTIPGSPRSGHGPGAPHLKLTDPLIPPDWQMLPQGVIPVPQRN
ncbi:hypothetical protein Plim_1593 [Planctopirus limnophila DSM 3776]|uniref:Uncharacterized protein n=1 Tax=Planctopirus limnophila (strain ATCC 43296 / DSM 3776 / IFAM 1008 / Mu 290) TaxID=521674 RepID=D5SWS6_PLAL2|nr:hypothetical protein [Planctopirus limnophila]ADG67426.1 hypothetical protein Plim_1593 [Planctopirus limnophila DSM 3776]